MTWFLVSLILLTAAAGAWAAKAAARAAFARGKRESELEAAPLRERAADLQARLAAAETRVENAQQTFREMQSQKGALEATASERKARLAELEEELRGLRARLDALAREHQELGNRSAGFEAALKEIRARDPEMKEALAAFLQEKGQSLTKHNAETLKALLDPLQARLQEFEKKVEDADKSGLSRHVEFKAHLEQLAKMNDSLGQEARNLTVALKGENKKGGNWGEVVLERVLESSGLEKGREYRVQPSYNDGTGAQQPDVVIDLPDNRHLVIDSKVSLLAYERYCSAETPEIAEAEMKAHLQSIRSHIDGLSGKRYHEIHALNSVDFVFLFLPVEPAFIEASKRDPALFQSAFAKNIILVSPSTLLATLRTVDSIWKQENQNRHVREIARQAGALYDKFVGFLADLDKIGRSLAATQESFNEARSKLSGGKGNLVSRVQNLQKFGVKSSKEIPMTWRGDDEELPDMPEHTSETLPLL
jgi:DNA recombination protein RmuC